uniref:Uncharacterized protein n=1 Tax=Cannabis sativa TaxID=3483 RepID=A0A803NI69_CANSA
MVSYMEQLSIAACWSLMISICRFIPTWNWHFYCSNASSQLLGVNPARVVVTPCPTNGGTRGGRQASESPPVVDIRECPLVFPSGCAPMSTLRALFVSFPGRLGGLPRERETNTTPPNEEGEGREITGSLASELLLTYPSLKAAEELEPISFEGGTTL